MKPALKIVAALVSLLFLSGIGGYFYVRKMYEAPANQLQIARLPVASSFVWLADTQGTRPVAHAALLVPVVVPGCAQTCYLQFDSGAPYSLLYSHPLTALQQQYPAMRLAYTAGHDTVTDFQFGLGNGQITSRSIQVRPMGARQLPAPDSKNYLIIGTLGTDIMDGRVLLIDYARQQFRLSTAIPDSLTQRLAFVPLSFESRRVQLTPELQGKPQQLLFDTGSSAFALLTSESTWQDLAKAGAPVQAASVNSWGKKLTSYTVPSTAQLGFDNQTIPLGTVTHIEGTTFFQNVLMRFSGMGGMLGNEPFANQIIVLDVKGRRFGILQPN
ncbi:hypothetical protein GCM10011375_29300 [Hymenobacter qilianensis]|uniref:Uncharacterized protein n=2 Tax=Hymenobacter qilianensis TaxID=1385715 RepID=A0ACB5PUB4_9BACT|nr:hypothetical protein [Hymenobacter qilianensis]QNP51742.1 hypothetical protein H9L05_17530 [Hymenobacter qilianensis]GGF72263.1 hypothetical protein GCM10011375_29300 [Hymenobacter qilianensis]